MAALRRQPDVAYGNIVGSNIYNILRIGGETALIALTEVPAEIVGCDNLVMIAASLLLLTGAFTARRISRREGSGLLFCHLVYVAWIWP
jgi:cation:H+ antiporter